MCVLCNQYVLVLGYVWRIPGVDGQVINNQGYQNHQGCQSYMYLAGDTGESEWITRSTNTI